MNNLKTITAITAFAVATLSSCIEEKDLSQLKPVQPGAETYTEVELNVGGECSVTEKPMGRAALTNVKGIYGITVSQWVKDASGRVQSKPYAYGIFDNVSNLKVNLLDGYKYRIACTMVKDGADSIAVDNKKYGRPFTLDKNGSLYGGIQNKFLVADQQDGSQLFLFDADNSKIETKSQNKDITRPFVERYHGVIDSLVVGTVGNEIEMYRRYFAVKFAANGLREGYRLEIQLDDSPKWILNGKTGKATVETGYNFVSFKSLTGKINTGTIATENAIMKVELFKNGVSQGEIMKYSRSFKRNYQVTIAISDIDHFGTDAGLGITFKDEAEMENDPIIDLPWQGGE